MRSENQKTVWAILLTCFLTTILLSAFFLTYATRSGSPVFEHPGEAYTYTVWKEGSTFYCKDGLLGNVSSSADDDTLIQNAISAANNDGGGTVFVKSQTYSASVTVEAFVLLLLEAGVTGITYTVNSNGYCLRYSGGYVWYEQPLNMTGHELRFGVFHTGTSAPNNMATGQWWYDTSSYVLKIYNGTDWASVATGAQGPAGPAGQVQGMDYHFLVFENTTATYLLNGETGEIDDYSTNDANVMQWSLGNLTGGRDYYERVVWKGNFEIDKTVLVDSWTEIELVGKVKRANNVNDDMIRNEDNSNGNDWITIHGGYWDGNAANNGAGKVENNSVFHFHSRNGGPQCDRLHLYDMQIRETEGHGLYLARVGRAHIHDIEIRCNMVTSNDSGYQCAVYMRGCADNNIRSLLLVEGGINGAAIYLRGVQTNEISDLHLGGGGTGIWIRDSVACNRFDNIYMDEILEHGIYLQAANIVNNTFTNIYASDVSKDTDNLYDFLYSTSTSCTYNTWVAGGYCKRDTGSTIRYGVYEANAGTDYNTYIGFDFHDVGTSGFNVNSNSKVALSWNGTTWIS